MQALHGWRGDVWIWLGCWTGKAERQGSCPRCDAKGRPHAKLGAGVECFEPEPEPVVVTVAGLHQDLAEIDFTVLIHDTVTTTVTGSGSDRPLRIHETHPSDFVEKLLREASWRSRFETMTSLHIER